MMRFTDSDLALPLSASPDHSVHAGPSSLASSSFDGIVAATNGHTNGFGHFTNGNSTTVLGNGHQKRSSSIAKVTPPGTTLYEDSQVDREEFVRLVIQSLRDIGYVESASTLEAESGYTMESPEVSQFRQFILDGKWAKGEAALERLVEGEEGLWDAKFLISRQKYLELVEARKPTSALQVLRSELTPLNVEPDHLHTLSSLIMCTEPEDLRRRANWDGASGTSRHRLLDALHDYIPSGVMIPQRRFATLLEQVQAFQRLRCTYHNPPPDARFSLYSDHRCSKNDFPRITTTILEVHTDEVWNIEWSHDGDYLASGSKDKSAIIWRRGSAVNASSSTDWSAHLILRDHPYAVGCLAWSLDDSVLLTSAEHFIKMWNTQTGSCIHTLDGHSETITTLMWLSDGTGFVSGGLDRKVTIWNADGKVRDTWGPIGLRLTGLSVTPDLKWLVGVGIEHTPYQPPDSQSRESSPPSGAPQPVGRQSHKLIVYDMATKQQESSARLEGELMSVKTSPDSQYLLINHSPNEIQLWDLQSLRIICKYKDLKHSQHVIRSCFGGIDGNFIVSGSEDATVYVWHRDTGVLLEALTGHGEGTVNSVAWNPTNERMFASCSDDGTIRIWEPPPHGVLVSEPPSEMPEEPSTSTLVAKGKGKTEQAADGSEGAASLLGTWFDDHHNHHL